MKGNTITSHLSSDFTDNPNIHIFTDALNQNF